MCLRDAQRNTQLSRKETQSNTHQHIFSSACVRVTIWRCAKVLTFRTTSFEKKKKKTDDAKPAQDNLRATVGILCIKLANLNSADTDGKKKEKGADLVLNVGRKRLVPARPWGIVSRRGDGEDAGGEGGSWKHKRHEKRWLEINGTFLLHWASHWKLSWNILTSLFLVLR